MLVFVAVCHTGEQYIVSVLLGLNLKGHVNETINILEFNFH